MFIFVIFSGQLVITRHLGRERRHLVAWLHIVLINGWAIAFYPKIKQQPVCLALEIIGKTQLSGFVLQPILIPERLMIGNGSPFPSTWASYQIRKIAGCACAGNAGNVSPLRRFRRKPLFSDPGMHHGTCVTHVPWCMSGSLTCGDGENVPGIPGACAPAILRIWQEAHWWCTNRHQGNEWCVIDFR